jgi:hypothetical protein
MWSKCANHDVWTKKKVDLLMACVLCWEREKDELWLKKSCSQNLFVLGFKKNTLPLRIYTLCANSSISLKYCLSIWVVRTYLETFPMPFQFYLLTYPFTTKLLFTLATRICVKVTKMFAPHLFFIINNLIVML